MPITYSTIAALPVPPATGALPDVPDAIGSLTTALDPIVTPKFDTLNDAQTAYAGLSNTARAGSRCYIRNRGGCAVYDSTSSVWRWEKVERILFAGTYSPGYDTNNTTGASLIGIGSAVTLPPGNRNIQVYVSTFVENQDSGPSGVSSSPRVHIYGTGVNVSDPDNWIQTYLPAGSQKFQASLKHTFDLTMNGTCDVGVWATVRNGGVTRFSNTRLKIVDTGPTG